MDWTWFTRTLSESIKAKRNKTKTYGNFGDTINKKGMNFIEYVGKKWS